MAAISRRRFLNRLGVGVSAAALAPVARGAAGERPNFLFLFTDDQTFRSIHALNNPDVKTPNLDRLVRRGVTFTHAFNQGSWSGAVCICSRAMLNTGMYIYHAQRHINSAPLWGETLGNAGYETFLTGKWHNGNATAVKSFKHGRAIGRGMYGAGQLAYGRPADGNPWSPSDPQYGGHWRPTVWDIETAPDGTRRAGRPYAAETHTSELYAGHAVEFLRTTVPASTNPFFMYVSFNAPHDPRQSPQRYVDMYPPESLRLPPNLLPEHPFDQGDHRIRDETLAPFPRSEEAVRLHLSEYYAIITHFDAQLGRILDALDASGKADSTYVIFSSDHGLAVGQHGLMGKQNQYEHSIRVPLVVAGPGLQAGRRVDAMVYLHSLFATTCDWAEIPVPESVEFPSLVPLLDGRRERLHDAVFGSYRHFQRMVRTDRHKLIVYPVAGRTQLFDLREDPWETRDLSADPALAALAASLRGRLQALQVQVGDTLDLDAAAEAAGGGGPAGGGPARPGHPVKPDDNGVYLLVPAAAKVRGRLTYQPDRDNLGAWFNPEDYPEWNLEGVAPGTYQVEFAYGCVNPGVAFEVVAGGERVGGVTEHTGGLKTDSWFPVGRLRLAGGDVSVSVRPGPFTKPIMNVRRLRLTPAKP